MAQEKFTFQAEVSKLLKIVANSLYSHKEIFLRELISNASDACDKLRYESLTNPDLIKGDTDFQIRLGRDEKARTLTIWDNGIGMNREDLLETLGTIARSGTQAFMENLGKTKDDKEASVNLIGQFGVGFYSSFMVADKVEVVTRKAGEDKAWKWVSDGQGEFTIEEAERDVRGTTVTLHLTKDDKEYVDEARIRNIVKTYSDHIAIPVLLEKATKTDNDADAEGQETLNTASALWTRPKKDITEDQYKEFYHHTAHAFDDPWLTVHNAVEGVISYTNLLFIPSMPPMDLFNPERKSHLKLYVNKVFVTDDCDELLPSYLRFVKGIVDTQDLSLNVSREMLQHDPKLTKIRKGLTKRLLGELKKQANKGVEIYGEFWDNFGAVVKEGLYEDFENREKILEITRFYSALSDKLISLDDYVENMKEGQEAIYYITGDDRETAARSPQLEGYKAKGVDVLFLTDPVDEFWVGAVGNFKDKPLKSVTQGGADLSKINKKEGAEDKAEDKKDLPAGLDALIAGVKLALGDTVKDVRPSERLTDSAVCLVADEGDMGLQMEKMLKAQRRIGIDELTPRILEINPDHALIKGLAGVAEKDAGSKDVEEAAHLLFDQARILEGEPVKDPIAFAKRLTTVMQKGLGQSDNLQKV